MRRTAIVIGYFCVISTLAWGAESSSNFEKYWPTWRGPNATGVAPEADPPMEWSENKNVRWKISIPGKGHSSPIVWGDHVFVTTAIETDKPIDPRLIEAAQQRQQNRFGHFGRREGSRPREDDRHSPRRGDDDGPPRREEGVRGSEGQRSSFMRGVQPTKIYHFDILALNRGDGRIVWQRTAHEAFPHEGTHNEGSWASNSLVTDGESIYAYFGSRGLYSYDMQGNSKWEKDFGNMTIKLGFGEGSSPVLYGETIIVNWDHEGQSFIIALDKKTGQERWKVNRDEPTSWSTPIVVEHNGRPQVITSATNATRSYNLATGELIWECGGMTMNTIPSPVSAKGMVYVTSGFRGNALQAIHLASAFGDISGNEKAVVWEYHRDTPYTPSPLLYGDKLYFLKRNDSILSCFNASTGQSYYGPQRMEGIEGNVFASPVGAANRVYLSGGNGTTLVIKHGPQFEVIAQNVLDSSFTASPAIVDNEIYLRGDKYLYCIAAN